MGLSNYVPSSRIHQTGICTSSTRPTSPYEGQTIYETDTNRFLHWTGTSWELVGAPVESPTFTGTVTIPTLSVTNTSSMSNTLSFPWSGTNIDATGTVKGNGAVVQLVANSQGASDLTSQGTIGTVTISPKYSTSTMLVWINYHAYKYNTTAAVNNYYRLRNATSGVVIRENPYLTYSSPEYMFQGVVSGTQAAGSTSSRQYSFLVDADGASRMYFYWTTMYAMEIAS